jgi:hypothetical protein
MAVAVAVEHFQQTLVQAVLEVAVRVHWLVTQVRLGRLI